MIVVQKTFTADNSDALSGTDLAQIPALGQLDLYLCSTQIDTGITITGPANEPIIRGQVLMQRTNGVISLQDDIPLSMLAVQGGKYVINIDVVTAATVYLLAIFRSIEEFVG